MKMKFSQDNLNRIISLLNEDDKKRTVFSNDEPQPVSLEEKQSFAEAIRSYSQLGEVMYGRKNLKESVERITKMVETAKRMISESDGDVVDKVSGSRHMKYVDSALTELQKSANEVMIQERRMAAAYEDIAEGLRKYYDVG
jgi:hypothetical protein